MHLFTWSLAGPANFPLIGAFVAAACCTSIDFGVAAEGQTVVSHALKHTTTFTGMCDASGRGGDRRHALRRG